MVFDNGVTNAQKIKSNFLSNLWNWTNLYSVVNSNSFVDFLAWLGCRWVCLLFVGVGRFFLVPFCCPLVHFLCTFWNLLVLLFYILFFIDKKKKILL